MESIEELYFYTEEFPFEVSNGTVHLLEEFNTRDICDPEEDKSLHSHWDLEIATRIVYGEGDVDDIMSYLEGFYVEDLAERLSSKLQDISLPDGVYTVDCTMRTLTRAYYSKQGPGEYWLDGLSPVSAEDFRITIERIRAENGNIIRNTSGELKRESLEESYYPADTFDDEAYFMYNYAATSIPATDKNLDIIESTFGQMSDGIWENSRAVEKYWQGMGVMRTKTDNKIVIRYRKSLFSDPEAATKYLAQKIKQVVKVFIQDTGKGEWARGCREECDYLSYDTPVTISDAYQLYDQLLNRNSNKFYY